MTKKITPHDIPYETTQNGPGGMWYIWQPDAKLQSGRRAVVNPREQLPFTFRTREQAEAAIEKLRSGKWSGATSVKFTVSLPRK